MQPNNNNDNDDNNNPLGNLNSLARKAELIGSDVEMREHMNQRAKFHSIIEQYIQFVYYLPFDSAVH